LGNSTQIAYFNSPTSITSEAAFNYDASLNRLGVNTSVPNATIGANAALDSGYSLLLKSDNANYNSIGFATDSTYGNMIQADRTGAAPSRNLTLYNYAGFMSLTEAGNLGIGLLVPNTGIDIYNSTNSQLWLHNAASGVTATDGVRLALFNNLSANLRNFDGPMSIASEGDFTVLTLGAENIRVNSADGKVGIGAPATVPEMLTVNGSIQQTGVLSSLLKTNSSGKLIAAVAGTDYQAPITLTTSGSSGAATFSSNTLNVPNYTLSGLGGVPTSRTLTINGVGYDLSADRSWTVGTMGGSGVDGRVAYYDGTNSITSESGFIYDSSSNRFGVNTVSPNATIGSNAGLDSNYSLLLKNSDTNYNGLGFRIDSTYGHMIETTRTGSAIARNLTMINNGGFFSVSEAGNFGFNILAVNTGVDIYASTNAQLWLHNGANTGSTQGARLAYFSNKSLNLRNFEGPLSLSSEGDFSVITLGAENIRVNSANGYVGIGNPSTLPSMLTVNGGATISALTTGQIVFPTSGGTLAGSSSLFWDNTNERLGIGTSTLGTRKVTIYSTNDAEHLHLIANAPALQFGNALTATYGATVGLATAPNNFITGAIAGDLCITTNSANSIYFGNGNTATQRMRLTASGDLGIGASSPDTKLDVRGEISLSYSASNGLRFYNQDRSNWSSIGNDTATGTSNANLVFRTSAGTALTIAANRNTTFATVATFSSSVGIGVSPSKTLDVYNSANTNTAQIKVGDGGSTARAYLGTFSNNLYLSCGGTYSSGWTTDGTNGIGNIAMEVFNGGSTISFATAASNTSPTTRMTITSTGQVAIGATSPTGLLNIYGGTSNAAAIFTIQSSTGGGGNSGVYFRPYQTEGQANANPAQAAITAEDDNYSSSIKFLTKTSGALANALVERMRIASGGEVGIGVTPKTYFSTWKALQIANFSLMGPGDGNGIIGANAYYDGNWKYTTSSKATLIELNQGPGDIRTYTTGTGTANNTISWTAGPYLANGGVSWTNGSSDIRKKKNFESSQGLAELLQIEAIKYHFNWDDNNSIKRLGFKAQNLQTLIPEMVVETGEFDEDGSPYLTITPDYILPVLVKAIQEQQAQIEELSNKIVALESK
jgi:hypothetical protein